MAVALRLRGIASVMAAAGLVTGGGGSAVAASPVSPWTDLTLSAAAVQPFVQAVRAWDIPVASLGYSEVILGGSPGCEATGAAYWLGVHEEDGPVEFTVPEPNRNKVGLLGVRNPLASNQVRPQPKAGGRFDWSDARPTVPAAAEAGPRWTSFCAESGTAGRATGNELVGLGTRTAGSTVIAALDGTTGAYTGTARAFIHDSSLAGAIDTVSTLLRVSLPANAAEPTVTYRLTLTRADVSATQTRVDDHGLSLAGTDVPVSQLATQFEGQRRAASGSLGALVGVAILAPSSVQTQADRYLLTAPAVVLTSTPGPTVAATDRPASGQPSRFASFSAGLRVGTATFSARR